jgi:hypothetical protein
MRHLNLDTKGLNKEQKGELLKSNPEALAKIAVMFHPLNKLSVTNTSSSASSNHDRKEDIFEAGGGGDDDSQGKQSPSLPALLVVQFECAIGVHLPFHLLQFAQDMLNHDPNQLPSSSSSSSYHGSSVAYASTNDPKERKKRLREQEAERKKKAREEGGKSSAGHRQLSRKKTRRLQEEEEEEGGGGGGGGGEKNKDYEKVKEGAGGVVSNPSSVVSLSSSSSSLKFTNASSIHHHHYDHRHHRSLQGKHEHHQQHHQQHQHHQHEGQQKGKVSTQEEKNPTREQLLLDRLTWRDVGFVYFTEADQLTSLAGGGAEGLARVVGMLNATNYVAPQRMLMRVSDRLFRLPGFESKALSTALQELTTTGSSGVPTGGKTKAMVARSLSDAGEGGEEEEEGGGSEERIGRKEARLGRSKRPAFDRGDGSPRPLELSNELFMLENECSVGGGEAGYLGPAKLHSLPYPK